MRKISATFLLFVSILFVLMILATQPAQAQAFTLLHTFTDGGDGGNPRAGLTIEGGISTEQPQMAAVATAPPSS